MPNPYHKIEDRMRYTEAHCPKCLSMDLIISKTINEIYCRSCDWIGNYEEMAFMKMRNHRDGTVYDELKERRGRTKKYDEEFVKKVVKYHKKSGGPIWKTAEKFGVSHATAGRMIKSQEG